MSLFFEKPEKVTLGSNRMEKQTGDRDSGTLAGQAGLPENIAIYPGPDKGHCLVVCANSQVRYGSHGNRQSHLLRHGHDNGTTAAQPATEAS